MDLYRAKELLACLADGVDPLTGEFVLLFLVFLFEEFLYILLFLLIFITFLDI